MLRAVAYLGIQCQLAEQLQARYGVRTILITSSPLDLATFRALGHDPSIFADIVYFDDIEMGAVKAPNMSRTELLLEIAKFENTYGVSLQDSVRTDRQYGMGYISGAKTMRTPFMKSATYDQVLAVAVRTANFLAASIARHNPKFIIGYPGALVSDLLISIAAKQGIPMRGLMTPRRANFFYWAADQYGRPASFEHQFKLMMDQVLTESGGAAPSGNESATERPRQASDHASLRKKNVRVRALLKGLYSYCVSSFSFYWFDHPRRQMIYLFSDRVTAFARSWIDNRKAMSDRPLAGQIDIETPFVLFPLHFEPEASLLSDAVDSPSQLTIIDWLARAAPSGWRVVVKEHPIQMLRRPNGFWEFIRRYPNVMVAAKFESGEELLERAAAVAVINGTLGLQAARKLKPVISFHRHYVGAVLPQMSVTESLVGLRKWFKTIQRGDHTSRAEGLLANEAWDRTWAIYEFPIEESELYTGRSVRKSLPEGEMDLMVQRLMESFQRTSQA